MAGSALGGLFGHDLGLLHCLCCLADIPWHQWTQWTVKPCLHPGLAALRSLSVSMYQLYKLYSHVMSCDSSSKWCAFVKVISDGIPFPPGVDYWKARKLLQSPLLWQPIGGNCGEKHDKTEVTDYIQPKLKKIHCQWSGRGSIVASIRLKSDTTIRPQSSLINLCLCATGICSGDLWFVERPHVALVRLVYHRSHHSRSGFQVLHGSLASLSVRGSFESGENLKISSGNQ